MSFAQPHIDTGHIVIEGEGAADIEGLRIAVGIVITVGDGRRRSQNHIACGEADVAVIVGGVHSLGQMVDLGILRESDLAGCGIDMDTEDCPVDGAADHIVAVHGHRNGQPVAGQAGCGGCHRQAVAQAADRAIVVRAHRGAGDFEQIVKEPAIGVGGRADGIGVLRDQTGHLSFAQPHIDTGHIVIKIDSQEAINAIAVAVDNGVSEDRISGRIVFVAAGCMQYIIEQGNGVGASIRVDLDGK